MKLINRIRKLVFPLWEVTASEPDFFEPNHLIRVKVKKPLGENSRIKVKGNSIGDGKWHRIDMEKYYIKQKPFRITEVSKDFCNFMVRAKVRVRVPALEVQHKDELRKLWQKEYRKTKMGR